MECPKCGNSDSQKINEEATHYYCQKCNNAFKKGSVKVEEGTLDFKGLSTAQQIFKILTDGRDDMSPELQSALEAQITGIIFEQWFEGMKAGMMANITYTRSYYDNGKTRSKPSSSTKQHEAGTNGSGSEVSNREDSSSGESNSGSETGNKRVRELVAGVKFTYFRHIKVPENIYLQVANLVDKHGVEEIKEISYDGSTLMFHFKT